MGLTDKAEIKRLVNEQVEAERREYSLGRDAGTSPLTKQILEALARNEEGDADLFIELNRERLVYDHATGLWHVFKGHHWEPDMTEQTLAGVSEVADQYLEEMKRQAWARAGAARCSKPCAPSRP